MKKLTKVFSIVMALVLMLSVAVLPANAVAAPSDAHVSFDLELAPVIGETDSNGLKSEENGIYKLTVYLTSDVYLYGIIMDIVFDETKFAPLDAMNDYQYTTDLEYNEPLFHRLGLMLDANSYDASGNPGGRAKYYGPSHSKSSTYEFKFTQTKTNALLWNYEPCENALELGGCTKEPVAEIYFKLLDGQQAEGAVFGFGTGTGVSAKSVTFDATPTAGKFFVQASANFVNILPLDIIGTPNYTYTGPVVTGPAVAKSKGQIKMTKTGADVADDFSFRVISKITDADWDAYFSGTLDSDELGARNAIQKVGFVVAESGNFVMNDAKNAAIQYAQSENPGDENLGVYKAATTNFIQKTGDTSDAFFACRIDTSVSTKSDMKYIAFVQYKDKDGNIQYAFYDEAQEILLDSKYGDYKAAWLSQNQG